MTRPALKQAREHAAMLLLLRALQLPAACARAGFGGLTLPPVVYGTEGWEGNIYYDNLGPSKHRDFEFEISITSKASMANEPKYHDMGDFVDGTAKQQVERLVFLPRSGSIADVVFQVTDRDTNTIVAKNRTVLLTTNRSAGAGKTASVLVIGDSLTAHGDHTGVLQDIAKNDSMKLQLVGTRGPTLTNRHEGRGGWTVHDYATAGRLGVHFFVNGVKVPPGGNPETASPEAEGWNIQGKPCAERACQWTFWGSNLTKGSDGLYSGYLSASYPVPGYPAVHVPASGVLTHETVGAGGADLRIPFSRAVGGVSLNPFWSGSPTGGKLDVGAYLRDNRLPTPNAATIMLGDNDFSGASTDAEALAAFAIVTPNLKNLVLALHAAGIGSVGLVLQPPPSSQDGFGENYGVMANTGAKGNWTQFGVSNEYREKRAMLLWWQAQIKLANEMMLSLVPAKEDRDRDPLLLLGRKTATNQDGAAQTVTTVPAGLNLDTVHNMDIESMPANARSAPNDPNQKVVRAMNGVHPAQSGQAQIADSLWAWLKFRTSLL